jgi:hypothetical protein
MMGLIKRMLNFLLHLVAIGVVIVSLRPIADWYLNLEQIPGSDYWNTGSYLQKLSTEVVLGNQTLTLVPQMVQFI